MVWPILRSNLSSLCEVFLILNVLQRFAFHFFFKGFQHFACVAKKNPRNFITLCPGFNFFKHRLKLLSLSYREILNNWVWILTLSGEWSKWKPARVVTKWSSRLGNLSFCNAFKSAVTSSNLKKNPKWNILMIHYQWKNLLGWKPKPRPSSSVIYLSPASICYNPK